MCSPTRRRVWSSSAASFFRSWRRFPDPICPPCGMSWSSTKAARFDALLQRGSPTLDAHAGQPRCAGILAVLVGEHGAAERVRAPAARHGRLRGALRERRARHHRGRSLLQRPQAVLRLRPGQRGLLPACRRRDEHSLARAAAARARLRDHRAASADLVLLGADRLRDAAGARRGVRSLVDPAGGLGGRSAAARHLRSLPAAIRRSRSSTASDRPRRSTCSSRTGLDESRPGTSGVVVAGYDARILDDAGVPVADGRDRQPVDQRRFDVRVLLEPAREVEGHVPRRVAAHRRQVLTGRDGYLLLRGPIRRHAEGRRAVGQPGRGRERAHRAPGGAGMRRGRPRRSRRADQAGGVRGAAIRTAGEPGARGGTAAVRPRSGSPSTSGRAGSSSCPSYPRPPRARFSDTACGSLQG